MILLTTYKTKNKKEVKDFYKVIKRFYPLSYLLGMHVRKHVFRTLSKIENNNIRKSGCYLYNKTHKYQNHNIMHKVFDENNKESSSDNLVIKKEPVLCLPKVFNYNENQKNYISGLISLSEVNRKVLLSNSSQKVNELLLYCIAKPLWAFLMPKPLEVTLSSVFHKIPESLINTKDISLYAFSKTIVTIQQHMQNIVWGSNKLPFKYLEVFCDKYSIDCSSYKDTEITMQTFVEVSALKDILSLSSLKDFINLKFSIINPNNLPLFFCVVRSRQHVAQNHGDILVSNYTGTTGFSSMFCLEIKTYTKNGIGRRTLSLFQPTKKLYQQEVNNIINSIKNLPPERKTKEVMQLLNNIIKIKETGKSPDLIFNNIVGEVITVMFKSYFEDINFSLSMPLQEDHAFTQYYETVLKKKLELLALDEKIAKKIEELYPINYKMAPESHKELIVEIIEQIFPESDALVIKKVFLETIDNL